MHDERHRRAVLVVMIVRIGNPVFSLPCLTVPARVALEPRVLPGKYCATAAIMTVIPTEIGLLLFGAVSSVSFFLPGFKYFRQRQRGTLPAR